jgi:hypothetical protein
MRYYDLKRNWTKRIMPHLDNAELNRVLVTDFNKFTMGRWGHEYTGTETPFPKWESCDWWLDHKGPIPRFWAYTKHAACHWIVNFALCLAKLAESRRAWRIISSDRHSTVWDRGEMLFDFNFQAIGIDPDECFDIALGSEDSEELAVGEYMETNFADHYRFDPIHGIITMWQNDDKKAITKYLKRLTPENQVEITKLMDEYTAVKLDNRAILDRRSRIGSKPVISL